MYAIYFIAAIAALVAVISYAIGRINKQSYLHTPVRLPSFRKAGEEIAAEPKHEKQLTRSEQHEQAYVEWFTQRNTAIHGQKEKNPVAVPKLHTQRKEPGVYVGVAVVRGDPVNSAGAAKPQRNIDRWYRNSVSA